MISVNIIAFWKLSSWWKQWVNIDTVPDILIVKQLLYSNSWLTRLFTRFYSSDNYVNFQLGTYCYYYDSSLSCFNSFNSGGGIMLVNRFSLFMKRWRVHFVLQIVTMMKILFIALVIVLGSSINLIFIKFIIYVCNLFYQIFAPII